MSSHTTQGTKDKLDETYIGVISNLVRMCQSLPEAERRAELLKLFNLPSTLTDAEVETTLSSAINTTFEQPVDPVLAERLLQLILTALRQS